MRERSKIEFDILNYASENSDYDKMNRCSSSVQPPRNSIPPSTYFYVAAIITLIIMAGIGMYKLGPNKVSDKVNLYRKQDRGDNDSNNKLI